MGAMLALSAWLGWRRSRALKTAIELDVFTAVADGAETVTSIASRCEASERGIRMLCDYLVTIGLLTKSETAYQLS